MSESARSTYEIPAHLLSPDLKGLGAREILGKRITYLWHLLNAVMLERGELSNNHPGAKPGNKSPELLVERKNISEEIVYLQILLNRVMAESGELSRGHVKNPEITADQVHFQD